ncbi:DUF4267 domain-containing protein [Nocardioides terrisoli]|uniref:DUF4267 domain-containing protein n=1 Tax=Nocardioides terrisoli TaxID=3388267 RepID=UPI00287BA00D|nr:DUF4267 domain-containing protein [Nocardioides marmorisolisilvae]
MNSVTGLSLGRIAIGATALASPELAAKLFRLDLPGNPQLPYMSRMFGSREVALGLATVLARGRSRRALTALGVAVDAADAYAGVEAGRSGSVTTSTSGFLTAPAVLAVAAGLAGLLSRGGRSVAAG